MCLACCVLGRRISVPYDPVIMTGALDVCGMISYHIREYRIALHCMYGLCHMIGALDAPVSSQDALHLNECTVRCGERHGMVLLDSSCDAICYLTILGKTASLCTACK